MQGKSVISVLPLFGLGLMDVFSSALSAVPCLTLIDLICHVQQPPPPVAFRRITSVCVPVIMTFLQVYKLWSLSSIVCLHITLHDPHDVWALFMCEVVIFFLVNPEKTAKGLEWVLKSGAVSVPLCSCCVTFTDSESSGQISDCVINWFMRAHKCVMTANAS